MADEEQGANAPEEGGGNSEVKEAVAAALREALPAMARVMQQAQQTQQAQFLDALKGALGNAQQPNAPSKPELPAIPGVDELDDPEIAPVLKGFRGYLGGMRQDFAAKIRQLEEQNNKLLEEVKRNFTYFGERARQEDVTNAIREAGIPEELAEQAKDYVTSMQAAGVQKSPLDILRPYAEKVQQYATKFADDRAKNAQEKKVAGSFAAIEEALAEDKTFATPEEAIQTGGEELGLVLQAMFADTPEA